VQLIEMSYFLVIEYCKSGGLQLYVGWVVKTLVLPRTRMLCVGSMDES